MAENNSNGKAQRADMFTNAWVDLKSGMNWNYVKTGLGTVGAGFWGAFAYLVPADVWTKALAIGMTVLGGWATYHSASQTIYTHNKVNAVRSALASGKSLEEALTDAGVVNTFEIGLGGGNKATMRGYNIRFVPPHGKSL